MRMRSWLSRRLRAGRLRDAPAGAAKRDAALQAGASRAIDGAAPDALVQVQQANGGGARAAIDFVGFGQTVGLAVGAVVTGGTVVVVDLYGGEITLPTPSLPLRAMTLRGSYVGSHRVMAELLELVQRAGMPPVPIGLRPLDEVGRALADLRAGRVVGRVVLTPFA